MAAIAPGGIASDLPITQVELKRITIQALGVLEPHLTPDARAAIEVELQSGLGGLVLKMRRHMLAVAGTEHRQSFVYPADWWQAVKERFAPRWFLRRWPVERIEHTLKVEAYGAVCPHHDDPPPAPHMQFLMDSRDFLPPAAEFIKRRTG
jgi:hypothetical protein